MSVYFINANDEEEGADEPEGMVSTMNTQTQTEAHQALSVFWNRVGEEIRKIKNMDLKIQALPLARIKKIMKLDEDVKMISAEAPVLFAKAAEIFIHELTLRAWVHTEDNKRRTLQRNDIAMAITKYDQFDFLIDIVPRDEVKAPVPQVKTENAAVRTNGQDQVQYYFQLAQQHQQALQVSNTEASNATQQAATATQSSSIIQIPAATPAPPPLTASTAAAATSPAQGSFQIVHQVVTASGEVQNIPLQLSPQQMQLIRMQLQNSSTNQPVILQSSQASSPGVLQL